VGPCRAGTTAAENVKDRPGPARCPERRRQPFLELSGSAGRSVPSLRRVECSALRFASILTQNPSLLPRSSAAAASSRESRRRRLRGGGGEALDDGAADAAADDDVAAGAGLVGHAERRFESRREGLPPQCRDSAGEWAGVPVPPGE
jgi:hypothetical protein